MPTPRCDEHITSDERIARLIGIVTHLAADLGPRNIWHYQALGAAADYIEGSFAEMGYRPVRQGYEARQQRFHKIIAERPGSDCPTEIIVVGAHYDSHRESPGANCTALKNIPNC